MKKIVFVCTGNICRSAMAHQYLQTKVKQLGIENDFLIDSCGIYASTGEQSTRYAIEVMKNYDVNMLSHRAKNIYDLDLKDYDMILCMTEEHKRVLASIFPDLYTKIYTLKEYNQLSSSDKDIKDPWGYDLKTYQECAKEIVDNVDQLLNKLKDV